MLRGLALGVAGMAIFTMLGALVVVPSPQQPGGMLAIAFGAATLFAIAAAVTLFAVEREAGTTLLLQILPQRPAAVLVGKLTAAVATTLLLLLALGLAGFAIGGAQWPTRETATVIASQGSVAIAEALIWGMVASLLCPNPLLAAVLGITAAALSPQIAMFVSVSGAHGFTIRDFRAAIPGRLALLALGAAADVWLGLRWLRIAAPEQRKRSLKKVGASEFAASRYDKPAKHAWTNLFARLVWQTVRQSWKSALAGLVLGVFLTFAFALIVDTALPANDSKGFLSPLGALFAPALLGALVFRADQRRGQFRFLAEHAGRPRTLWLARHAAWLAPLLLTTAALILVAGTFASINFIDGLAHQVMWSWNAGDTGVGAATALSMGIDVQTFIRQLAATTWLACCALLTAYGYGQFFSLALRSDIVAGMLALISSVVLVGWCGCVLLWRLPPLWFLAPLGLGAMLASWLRVRDWMLDRTGVTRWLGPTAALVLPIVGVLWAPPNARLSQMSQPYLVWEEQLASSTDLRAYAIRVKSQQSRGRDVADAYARLASALVAEDGEVHSAEQLVDEFIKLSAIDCAMPLEFAHHFRKGDALDSLIEFVLPGQQFPWSNWAYYWNNGRATGDRAPATVQIPEMFPGTPNLQRWLDVLLACERLAVQRERSLPLAYGGSSQTQRVGDPMAKSLVAWASAEGQTPELISRAIAELQAIDDTRARPADLLIREYLAAQRVVRGDLPPSFLRDESKQLAVGSWFAYLANELPWERRRAEMALDFLGVRALNYLLATEARQASVAGAPAQAEAWRRGLRGNLYNYDSTHSALLARNNFNWDLARQQAEQAVQAETSYLAAAEFPQARTIVEATAPAVAETAWRRAELVRLALMAYRLKEGKYPDSLDALSPNYLDAAQHHDPYSAGAFGYNPEGFELPAWGDGVLIPAKTPLLWCIGMNSAEPNAADVTLEHDARSNRLREMSPDWEPEPGGDHLQFERVMRLEKRYDYGAGSAFWLPLP